MLSCPKMISKQICKRVQNLLLSRSVQWIFLFRSPSNTTQSTVFKVTDFCLDPGHHQTCGRYARHNQQSSNLLTCFGLLPPSDNSTAVSNNNNNNNNNKEKTCTLIDVAIPADRNVVQKKAEKKLRKGVYA
jgi:hypothetical protein